MVSDLGSTNGHFLDGVRLKPREGTPLAEGEIAIEQQRLDQRLNGVQHRALRHSVAHREDRQLALYQLGIMQPGRRRRPDSRPRRARLPPPRPLP